MASLYLDSRGKVGHNLRQAEPQPPSGQRPLSRLPASLIGGGGLSGL
jgi:hypothetical protein